MHSRKKIALIVLVTAVLAGVVAVRLLGPLRHAAHSEQAAVYYCPMHPTYTSPRPGDCPICSMKLVRRESVAPAAHTHEGMEHAAEGPAGYASVRVPEEKRLLMGVKTAPVAKKRMVRAIRTVGRVAYDPELYQAQEEYLQAAQAKQAVADAHAALAEQSAKVEEAARLRLQLLGMEEPLIEELAARDRADRSLLLSDPEGKVWVYSPVYEFDLPWVKAEQLARVWIPSEPGRVLDGAVRSVSPVLDPMTRSARARILLVDPQKALRPEMYVNVEFQVDAGEGLVVPASAALDTGARQILFVDKGEGLLEPREVVLGQRLDGEVEVRQGVQEGERVVVSGNFLVDSESRLQGALQGMTPSSGSGEGDESGKAVHRHGP